MKISILLLLFSVVLVTNNAFSKELPTLICKNEKEIYFIKPDAIYYLLTGNEKLGVHNGLIAVDTEGKKRMLLQDLLDDLCTIGLRGGEA